MMNIYDGVVALDSKGQASLTLPEYFQALNNDFRYQLTAIADRGPNLYIAEEISGNHFKVAGGKPGGKVSWQVTGVRQNAYAKAHRINVEEDKPEQQRGYYLHPELFGATEKEAIGATGPCCNDVAGHSGQHEPGQPALETQHKMRSTGTPLDISGGVLMITARPIFTFGLGKLGA
jgi:hypothetical protein